jgi:glycosyltransferase involved in cell wall biosynthesis
MRIVITRRESFDLADGINAFVLALSDALMAAGHEVHLISASSSNADVMRRNFESSRFTSVYSLSDKPKPSMWEMFGCWRASGLSRLKEIQPSFILINGALPFRMPFPNCTISHDLEKAGRGRIGWLRRLFKIYSYRKTDQIVATCSELRLMLAAELYVRPESVEVIPTCVGLENYRRMPVCMREKSILHMGMALYKNPIASIRAFAVMKTRGTLYLTGTPNEAVKDEVAKLPKETQTNIRMVGILPSEELKNLLARVRALSVPSVYNTPVASPTAIDGLASGTPVVGTPSISSDLIDDGESGYRIDPGDTAGLAATFDLLLGEDETWQAFSDRAHAKATTFSNHRIAAMYIDLAQKVLARKA